MGLNIALLFKFVPNTTTVNVDPNTGTLVREGVPSVVNPHDLDAAEFALRLKEKYGGKVTAMIMAPPNAMQGLEFLIGMGVDEGVLLTDRAYGGADTLATSYVLAQGLKRIGFDLVVTGQETLDSSTAHIGAQIASWLKIPYVYYVVDAEMKDGKMVVTRQLENYTEKYLVNLPALVSVLMHSYAPRDVSLSNKLRTVTGNPITVLTNKELNLNPLCTGLRGSPTVVAKTVFVPKIPRKNQVLKDRPPAEEAKWLFDRLAEEGFV